MKMKPIIIKDGPSKKVREKNQTSQKSFSRRISRSKEPALLTTFIR